MRFDACAHAYDAHALPQREFAAQVAHFSRVPRGGTVVEFGAGTGALTRHLVNVPGAKVAATDVSPRMVALGRAAIPQAAWQVLDAFEDSLPAAQVQISSGLLQWAPDPGRVLRNWAGALGPGSRMVHGFPCEPCLAEWRAIVPAGPLVWRTEAEWLELFSGAGLSVLRKELWVEPWHFSSALDLVRGMHESGVTGRARLSAGQLRRAIRDYEAKNRTDAGVKATWAWLVVEAERCSITWRAV